MSAPSPLLAYAPWQARYALLRAAAPLGLFLLLGGIPLWGIVSEVGLETVRQPGEAQGAAMMAYNQMMTLSMTLGALISVSGLIALDRERQYFRFLFSQPVVPWQYYLQQFVISAVLFAAAMALIPMGFGLLFIDVPVLPVVQSAFLYALLFGSLALLCGALLNKDGLIFIGVLIFAITLQQAEAVGALPGWLGALANALPPFVAAQGVRAQWLAGHAAATGAVVHVLVYSLGMLAAALFVVRRAPLAR